MATHSSILAGKSHGQRSLAGCQREGHDLATKQQQEGKYILIIIPKKSNAKECSNYCTIALILHASKIMLKIFQARLQQYINQESQMYELNLEKAEEPGIKLPISAG